MRTASITPPTTGWWRADLSALLAVNPEERVSETIPYRVSDMMRTQRIQVRPVPRTTPVPAKAFQGIGKIADARDCA